MMQMGPCIDFLPKEYSYSAATLRLTNDTQRLSEECILSKQRKTNVDQLYQTMLHETNKDRSISGMVVSEACWPTTIVKTPEQRSESNSTDTAQSTLDHTSYPYDSRSPNKKSTIRENVSRINSSYQNDLRASFKAVQQDLKELYEQTNPNNLYKSYSTLPRYTKTQSYSQHNYPSKSKIHNSRSFTTRQLTSFDQNKLNESLYNALEIAKQSDRSNSAMSQHSNSRKTFTMNPPLQSNVSVNSVQQRTQQISKPISENPQNLNLSLNYSVQNHHNLEKNSRSDPTYVTNPTKHTMYGQCRYDPSYLTNPSNRTIYGQPRSDQPYGTNPTKYDINRQDSTKNDRYDLSNTLTNNTTTANKCGSSCHDDAPNQTCGPIQTTCANCSALNHSFKSIQSPHFHSSHYRSRSCSPSPSCIVPISTTRPYHISKSKYYESKNRYEKNKQLQMEIHQRTKLSKLLTTLEKKLSYLADDPSSERVSDTINLDICNGTQRSIHRRQKKEKSQRINQIRQKLHHLNSKLSTWLAQQQTHSMKRLSMPRITVSRLPFKYSQQAFGRSFSAPCRRGKTRQQIKKFLSDIQKTDRCTLVHRNHFLRANNSLGMPKHPQEIVTQTINNTTRHLSNPQSQSFRSNYTHMKIDDRNTTTFSDHQRFSHNFTLDEQYQATNLNSTTVYNQDTTESGVLLPNPRAIVNDIPVQIQNVSDISFNQPQDAHEFWTRAIFQQ